MPWHTIRLPGAHIRTAYGSAADGIIALEATARKNEPTARLRRIDTMEAHWDELNALLTELPSSQTVMDLLKSLDAPCLPIEIGVDADMLRSTSLLQGSSRPLHHSPNDLEI